MSLLNRVEPPLFTIEIGETGIAEVLILQKWLQSGKDPGLGWHRSITEHYSKSTNLPGISHWDGRFAPSILCRSEAELFAVSIPRFALRISLTKGSFANLRRLGTLCGQLEAWLVDSGRRWQQIAYRYFTPQPRDVLMGARCVADAFILPPKRLKERFDCIVAPLGKAYGECEANDPDILGTVYARHIKGGGGMCAQASCFMATALLPNHARAVHGVAEVTILARDPVVSATRISLSGLNAAEIQNYFRHDDVGLETRCQAPIIVEDMATLGNLGNPPPSIISFKSAIESYLRSGMPIIYPIDVGRMCGLSNPAGLNTLPVYYEGRMDLVPPLRDPLADYLRIVSTSILEKNGLDPDQDRIPGKSYGHAIVLLGCEAKENNWKSDSIFIFHDPAHFPFMKANATELFLSSAYGGLNSSTVLFGMFLPLTPRAVQMPLLREYRFDVPESEKDPQKWMRPGLVEIARFLQTGLPFQNQSGIALPTVSEFGLSKFRLTEFNYDSVSAILDPINDQPHWLRAVKRIKDLAAKQERKRWVWLQWDSSSIWVWNAESPPPDSFDHFFVEAVRYVLVVSSEHCFFDSGQLQAEEKKPEVVPVAKQNESNFRAAIISSFATSFQEALKHWPQQASHCELYAFMQSDAKALLPVEAKPAQAGHQAFHMVGELRSPILHEEFSAFSRMAMNAGNRSVVENAASEIVKHIKSSIVPSLEIVALASYFPGLSTPTLYRRHDAAVQAATFLVRFAKALQSRGQSKLKTIELVAGSLIRGITPPLMLSKAKRYEFLAHLVGEAAAINALIESLRTVVKIMKSEEIELRLALEFEPGPLNTLGTLKRLEIFCEKLENEPELREYVGLNLDIAHYGFLANLQPSQLSMQARRLFFHAHASSHGIGHFGDGVIENVGEHCLRTPEQYRIWVDAVPMASTAFSGFVSVEFEVGKTRSMLHDSWKNLGSILRWRNEGSQALSNVPDS